MGNKVLSPSLAVALLLGFAAPAWSQGDNAKAVIEKAIEAQGGAKNLAKLKTTHEKAKGNVFIGGMQFGFKADIYQELPTKTRTELTIDAGGMEIAVIEVLNGDKGWSSVAGQTKDVDDKELAQMKEDLHASYVTSLTPLLADKGFELTTLGEAKVDGKAAVGVKVAYKGRKDIKVYFDKESNLLVKVSRPGQDPVDKHAVVQDEFYSNYKVVDGVKQPHRVVVNHDDKKFMEAEILQFEFPASIDAKMFARPN
jgi:hypothetical protein